MRLAGIKSEPVTIDVRKEDIFKAMVEILCESAQLRTEQWIEDGNVVMEDPNWRHGSVSTVIVRPANARDIRTKNLIEELTTVFYGG